MRHRVSIVLSTLLAFSVPAANAAGMADIKPASMLEPRFASMAKLYANSPATVADYAAASARFRAAAEQGRVHDATPLVASEAPYFVPWLWATEDGATIRKKKSGAFVVTSAQLLANWYADTECFGAGWPTYLCADQTERMMSAPDAATIIFGDVEYKRVVPAAEQPDEKAKPLNASLSSDQTFAPLPDAE